MRRLSALLCLGLAALSFGVERRLTIRAFVPKGTPTVYVAGDRPELGPWQPDKAPMNDEGAFRSLTLRVEQGGAVEFKFTLGSWDREALGADGNVPPNHRVVVEHDMEVDIVVDSFKKDPAEYLADPAGGGVLGTLVYWRDVESKFLRYKRNVSIWLPPGYDRKASTPYPLLVMHDGQNLFDPRLANTGTDWGVDEAIAGLMKQGKVSPIVVVGVWNSPLRGREYGPWDLAPDYSRFLIEELLPKVRAEFHVTNRSEAVGTMGSSMGGLISFYLCKSHAETFGLGGCVSTHFPFSAQSLAYMQDKPTEGVSEEPLILRDIREGATFPKGPRLWFDYGTEGLDAQYAPVQAQVDEWLKAQGIEFKTKTFHGASHNEAAWRARLPEIIEWLYGPLSRPQK